MRIEFSNGFLLFMGTVFGLINVWWPSIFLSFMFGLCFGQIYLNIKRNKDKKS